MPDIDLDRLTVPLTELEIAVLQDACRDHLSVHGLTQFRRLAFQRQKAVEENADIRARLDAVQALADSWEREERAVNCFGHTPSFQLRAALAAVEGKEST